MTTFTASDLAVKIIHEQEAIIGPLAWNVARHISGMTVKSKDHVTIPKSGSVVLANLVKNTKAFSVQLPAKSVVTLYDQCFQKFSQAISQKF